MVFKTIWAALFGGSRSAIETPAVETDKDRWDASQSKGGAGQGGGTGGVDDPASKLQFENIPSISDARLKYADDPDQLEDFDEMARDAEFFLLGFDWHRSLLESRVGLYCAGIYGVYLFRIEPVSPDIPEWMWVVEGGTAAPPAIIPIDGRPNGVAAFYDYVFAIQEWVDAVKNGESTDYVIPVDLPPTLEEAQRVERQLRFMSKDVYPDEVEFFGSQPVLFG